MIVADGRDGVLGRQARPSIIPGRVHLQARRVNTTQSTRILPGAGTHRRSECFNFPAVVHRHAGRMGERTDEETWSTFFLIVIELRTWNIL